METDMDQLPKNMLNVVTEYSYKEIFPMTVVQE